uniref:Uncharacterized protein n=1 Tax=Ananas comosus var. bracteatus TaxID=296719 RepID=A0A6V7Q6U7_ANACO|nr:unnamed protein product [Ananas comosus var. bracteatus]
MLSPSSSSTAPPPCPSPQSFAPPRRRPASSAPPLGSGTPATSSSAPADPDAAAEVLFVAHGECGTKPPALTSSEGAAPAPSSPPQGGARHEPEPEPGGPLSSKFSESKLLWVILSKVNSVVDSLNLNSKTSKLEMIKALKVESAISGPIWYMALHCLFLFISIRASYSCFPQNLPVKNSSAICLRNRSVEALTTAALVQAIRDLQEPRTLQG